jgi:hypothetical protein
MEEIPKATIGGDIDVLGRGISLAVRSFVYL